MSVQARAGLVLTAGLTVAACGADGAVHQGDGGSGVRLEGATFVGGEGDEMFRDCVVDAEGRLFVVGYSGSPSFPVGEAGFQPSLRGGSDAVVLVLSADLTRVIAGTFLGGSGDEKNAYGVDLDPRGNLYLCGESRSDDFPTTDGAVQPRPGGGDADAFAAKLTPALDRLVYATYLGGRGKDACRGGLVVDSEGSAYFAGWTESADFPTTPGSFQPAFGGGHQDGWVARLDPGGSLSFSTFLGGSWGSDWRHSEYVVGLGLGADGSIVMSGSTTAADFPKPRPAREPRHSGNGVADAFVGKLSADGTNLSWLTYVAGKRADWAEHRLGLDETGHVYVVGSTASRDFPVTAGAAQTRYGGGESDIFVARITPRAAAPDWATFVGGGGRETAFGVVLDDGGNVWLAGSTESDDFPVTADAAQARKGRGRDAVLVRIAADGSRLDYSTFFGGDGDETARFVCGGPGGDVYAIGHSSSRRLPALRTALQAGFGGGPKDAFVARFRTGPRPAPAAP